MKDTEMCSGCCKSTPPEMCAPDNFPYLSRIRKVSYHEKRTVRLPLRPESNRTGIAK
jgi:hypothetical protein